LPFHFHDSEAVRRVKRKKGPPMMGAIVFSSPTQDRREKEHPKIINDGVRPPDLEQKEEL